MSILLNDGIGAVSNNSTFNLTDNKAFYFHKIFEIHLPRAIPTEIFTAVVIYWCNEWLQIVCATSLLAAKR